MNTKIKILYENKECALILERTNEIETYDSDNIFIESQPEKGIFFVFIDIPLERMIRFHSTDFPEIPLESDFGIKILLYKIHEKINNQGDSLDFISLIT